MTTLRHPGPVPGALRYVAELTFLEFARRKDAYVVAIFMGLFALGTVVTRITGVDSAGSARLIMSTGLALSHLLAAILMATFCGRLFPEEFERRTLLVLLAKPVSRGQVFIGKIGTSIVLVWVAYLIFVGMTLLTAPLVEGQSFLTLVEVALLRLAALAMLGLLAATLSLYMNTVVTVLVSLVWYFGASFSINLLRDLLEEWTILNKPLLFVARALPDAGLLGHEDAFVFPSSGLPATFFLALAVYAIAWSVAFGFWGRSRFERMGL